MHPSTIMVTPLVPIHYSCRKVLEENRTDVIDIVTVSGIPRAVSVFVCTVNVVYPLCSSSCLCSGQSYGSAAAMLSMLPALLNPKYQFLLQQSTLPRGFFFCCKHMHKCIVLFLTVSVLWLMPVIAIPSCNRPKFVILNCELIKACNSHFRGSGR